MQKASGTTAAAELSVPVAAQVGAGDLLVGQFRTTGTPSVSDSRDGSWREAAETSDGGVVHSLWYRQGAAAGLTTVTATGGSGGPVQAVLAGVLGGRHEERARPGGMREKHRRPAAVPGHGWTDGRGAGRGPRLRWLRDL